MTPVHHPVEEELVGYASGTNPEWISLVVACHLTYCTTCRQDVELFDDLGGVLLDTLGGQSGPLSVSASGVAARPKPEAVVVPSVSVPGLPRALGPYLPRDRAGW